MSVLEPQQEADFQEFVAAMKEELLKHKDKPGWHKDSFGDLYAKASDHLYDYMWKNPDPKHLVHSANFLMMARAQKLRGFQ